MDELQSKARGPYLRASQAAAYVGLPRSSFYRLIDLGVLPKPLRIGERASLFSVQALEAALDNYNNKKVKS